jgi:PAS domain-containing protein
VSAIAQPRREESYVRLDSRLIRAAWQACTDTVAIVQQGRVLYANLAFARAFGYLGGAEMQGRPLSDFAWTAYFLTVAAPGPQGKYFRQGHSRANVSAGGKTETESTCSCHGPISDWAVWIFL